MFTRRNAIESLERRALLANVVWDGGPTGDGTNFLDATNWVGDALPSASDTATIGATGTNPIISIAAGTAAVQAVVSSRNIRVAGGTISGGNWAFNPGSALSASVSGGTLSNVAVSGSDLLLDTTSARLLLAGNTSFPAARLSASGADLQMAPGYTLNSLVVAEGAATGSRIIALALGAAGTVTFGPSAVVRLASGSGAGLTLQIASAATLINHGLISAEASGQTLSINSTALTNNGTVQVTTGTMTVQPANWSNPGTITAGTGTALNLGGTWSNPGSLSITGATLNLGGTFTTGGFNFAGFARTGGTVNLTGTLNNNAATLTLDANTGSWRLQNGTINNGAVVMSGASLLLTLSSGTLNSVTVTGGDLLLDTANARLLLAGNTSFPAARISATGADLQMAPGYTLNSLVVAEGAATGSRIIALAVGAAGTVTFGPSAVVRLASGTGAGLSIQTFSAATLVNNGLISAEASGQTLSITNTTMTNNGTLQATAGTMIVQPTTLTNFSAGTLTAGTWRAAATGTLRFNGVNITTNSAAIVLDGPSSNIYNATTGTTSALTALTTNAVDGTLTLANGRDLSITPSGGTFTNSGTLNLGAGSTLGVSGAFTQPGSTLHVDIGGPSAATDFGQVAATGSINLNGSLTATLVGGYDPGFAVSFPVVVGTSRTGTFSTFSGGPTASNRPLRARYSATSAIIGVAPLVPSAPDLTAASDSGVLPTDNITNDNTPTFTGTAENGTTVRLYADGTELNSAAVVDGAYSVTASVLGEGVHSIAVKAEDSDPDLSDLSTGLSILIDTVAPATPAAMDLRATSDSGVSSSDDITNDATPTFDFGSTDTYHRINRNGTQVSGDYVTGTSYTAPALADGEHDFELLAVDAAGNVSPASSALNVTVDTTAPSITNPGNQGFEIVNTAGTTVIFNPATASDILDPSPVVTHLPSNGSSFLPGATTVNATATDLAGNSAGTSFTVTLNDSPFIVRGSGAAYAFTGVAGAQTLRISAGQVTFVADAGLHKPNLVVVVDGSGTALAINTAQHLNAIDIHAGAAAAISLGSANLLVTKAVSISGSGRLDLNDNNAIVDYAGATQLAAIQMLINAGRSGGTWSGAGITSTAAKNANPKNTTLGAMEAIDYKLIHGANATFDGQPLDNSAVVIKYTYYGDVDFNGIVDFDDYSRIDAGFNNNRTGWLNGDVDGNGIVDFDDYSLIDQAFNTQSGTR